MATTVRFFQRCLIISLLAAASWSAARAEAAALPVTVYLFTAQGCLHCRQEKDFLDRLEQTCPGVKVVVLELTESQENQALFARVAKKLQAKMAVVPFTVIGEQFLVGWQDSETTGKTIEELILKAQSQNWPDVVAALRDAAAAHPPPEAAVLTERLTLPLVGAIELRHLSIVVLTVIIAALDGFNPCAMWVLVFLIGLLLGMGDRRKMWVLGSVFIAASGLVYLLFMTA
jgi:glutaredoxin